MNLVLLGPPGAGKGTLASLLKESFNILHISTGDLLREEMKKKSPLGQRAQKFVEEGKLVPDEIVTQLIEQQLVTSSPVSGYLLDGFPRTETQAKVLDKILEKISRPLDYAIYLESTFPVILSRLTGRRVCRNCSALFHVKNRPPRKEGVCDYCQGPLYQRSDDNEGTIRTRLDVYLKNTLPIIEYYKKQGILRKLDSDKNSEEVQRVLLKIFNEDRQDHHH